MYCNKCMISVDESLNKCPLCKIVLTDTKVDEDKRMYPLYKDYNNINLKYNLFIYGALIISIISLFVNLFIFNENLWSVFVIGISFYIWFFIKYTIYSNSRVGEKIFNNFLVVSILLFIFDKVAGNIGWAFDYTIPVLVIGIIFSINMIIFIYKYKWRDYFIYHVMFLLICISSFIYYMFSETSITWVWSVAVYFSSLSVLVMIFKLNKKLALEFKKRLHI